VWSTESRFVNLTFAPGATLTQNGMNCIPESDTEVVAVAVAAEHGDGGGASSEPVPGSPHPVTRAASDITASARVRT
jgi:hypothetical protein